MSLFQCDICGCVENTALAGQGIPEAVHDCFDWTGIEDRMGKQLCSEHAPSKYSDGSPSKYGKWHGIFKQTFLPIGMFKTNREGNLSHIETGDTDYRKYEVTKG